MLFDFGKTRKQVKNLGKRFPMQLTQLLYFYIILISFQQVTKSYSLKIGQSKRGCAEDDCNLKRKKTFPENRVSQKCNQFDNFKIAMIAASDAKNAADAQTDAAAKASLQVRIHYAEKAVQAAKTAQSDLGEKQQIVCELNRKLQEIQVYCCKVSEAIESSYRLMKYASATIKEFNESINLLKSAVARLSSFIQHMDEILNLLQRMQDTQSRFLENAKNKIQCLENNIAVAREQYAQTKEAAYKAACAAKEAAENAKRSLCLRNRPSE